MKRGSLKGQALVLAGSNAVVRALGFLLHVVLSRLLGPQALGVMELAHNVHMLSIVPVTAGLPLAVSRLTAQREDAAALRAGDRRPWPCCWGSSWGRGSSSAPGSSTWAC